MHGATIKITRYTILVNTSTGICRMVYCLKQISITHVQDNDTGVVEVRSIFH